MPRITAQDSRPQHVLHAELSRGAEVVRPFLAWPFLVIASLAVRAAWPDNGWVIAFLAAAAVLLAVLAWMLVHTRHVLGYVHAITTVLLYGAIAALADAAGLTKLTAFALFVVIPVNCLAWAMRGHTRHAEKGHGLGALLEMAGMGGAAMVLHAAEASPAPRRPVPWKRQPDKVPPPVDGRRRGEPVTGTLVLAPGETAETAVKKAGNLESAAGLPPGALTITPDKRHAGRARFTLSDPLSIEEPVPWPGPSLPGRSIAEPVSAGLYQDGTGATFLLPRTQLQLMGMTGSGKSFGGAWSILAEVITRHDAAVWAIDVTKGQQTLGALAPALHRFATTPADAGALLADVQAIIRPRTDYLAARGLGKWAEGCGLRYLVVWIEEVPEAMEAIGDDGEAMFVKMVRTAGSAGITVGWSLQRSDYSQIPTIARGQAVKMCFGVADSGEAHFGLSDAQNAADCSPELWGNRQPGMAYLDAPGVPRDKIPLPMRAWFFGENTDSVMRAHAAMYPASARPCDEIMAAVPGDVPGVPDISEFEAEFVSGDGAEDDVKDGELDAELEPLAADVPLGGTKVAKMDPGQARAVIRAWLAARPGQQIRNADFTDVRRGTGLSRPWGYQVLGEFEDEGLVTRSDGPGGIIWTVTTRETILSAGVT